MTKVRERRRLPRREEVYVCVCAFERTRMVAAQSDDQEEGG